MSLKEAKQKAFGIVTRHGDCLQDDTPLDGLINDIAAAMVGNGNEFAWLIEAPGQRYLAVQNLSSHSNFIWSQDHNEAIRFYTKEQATGVIEALRTFDRIYQSGMFTFQDTLGPAQAVEHGWMGGPSDAAAAG